MRLIRVARAIRAVIVPAVVAALVAFPLGVLASHSFSDVPNTHPFHADIAALKDSGVSPTGCGGGKFCPDDFVTRGQMAAFLNRLGALGPGKVPVTNATKLDGLDSTAFQRDATIRLSTATPVTTEGLGVAKDWVSLPFTQPAGRALVGYVAEATATVPPTCTGNGNAVVQVWLDGVPWGSGTRVWSAPTANTLVPIGVSTFGPGSASPGQLSNVEHTFLLQVHDQCSDGSDWTFTSAIIDVILLG